MTEFPPIWKSGKPQLARWGHEVVLFSEGTIQPPTQPYGLSKVECLRNNLLDQTQILNLGLDNKAKVYKCFKWRPPSMKDEHKILVGEFVKNPWLDHLQILNLSYDVQPKL